MARNFNGTSDKFNADAAHVTNGTGTAFTIVAWVNGAGAQSGDVYAEGFSAGAGPFFQWQVNGAGKLQVSARSLSTGSADSFTSVATLFDSTWHHACLTQGTTSNMSLYAAGALDSTFTRTSLSNNGAQSFNRTAVGYLQRNTASNFFAGRVAHVATWTRALSANEVASLAGGVSPALLAPAHYWPIWGVDSPEPDLGVGSHVPGVLVGTSAAVGSPAARSLVSA